MVVSIPRLATLFLFVGLEISTAFFTPTIKLTKIGPKSFQVASHRITDSPSMILGAFQKPKSIPAELESIKLDIIETAQGTSNGVKASQNQKNKIEELAISLEKLCPTKSPAKSELSNGEWTLVYTTNTGNSSGKLGPFVGKVTQVIDLKEDRYFNIVEVGPLRAELEATWIVRGNINWTVIFKTVAFKLFGAEFLKKYFDMKSARGNWMITYVDEDFRIIRASGREGVTNIYVLAKPHILKSQ
mmetsp:Transcript_19249/g.25357  ORF Transcript_19249/g.25357 Transcript_19249/m.25357 type:complete len:244 (-) Transcript_19249:4-735(-)|eukprot:CAMPEP_0117787394 /NCGR_PEP_ID=MMETSP0948-20121206/6366_1 /TAXON_ID=44440 /ORGANISM="Chattonella subsalsa, Strain CCMP2191" /LENGTH=243 /DNA_ID=CAMNT_0005616509 /DNA_START=105 /DNA_END=839 /DNA_ORIENTATION=+